MDEFMSERMLLRLIKEQAEALGGFDCEVGRAVFDANTLDDVLKLVATPRGRE